MSNELEVLQGRVKTLRNMTEDKEVKELACIMADLIAVINKKEAGFKK